MANRCRQGVRTLVLSCRRLCGGARSLMPRRIPSPASGGKVPEGRKGALFRHAFSFHPLPAIVGNLRRGCARHSGSPRRANLIPTFAGMADSEMG